MATVLKTPPFRSPPPPPRLPAISLKSPKTVCVSFRQRSTGLSRLNPLLFSHMPSYRFVEFAKPFASHEEAETETAESQEIQEVGIEDTTDGAVGVEHEDDGARGEDITEAEDTPASAIVGSLQLYKEALASNDESRVAEIESFLKSVEDEKVELESKVSTLSEELSIEKVRILRISADFDNFRKRTEKERLSLVTNAQGEVVESLLPVLDNFERAKAQIKVETEGEEKINNSYQSIYKQFIEILDSLGVVPVETVGNPFDPLLHEAIMREDSAEFEEDIIIQEFRKGFKLGDRLLRPSMVKVSAGPGPTKTEQAGSSDEAEVTSETSEESSAEAGSA